MLVALCHMQVNVCFLRRYKYGSSGMTGFRTNIIAFPQDALELKALEHFWSNLQVHDIVNVRLPEDKTVPRRARVLRLDSAGIWVQVPETGETRTVQKADIEQRVRLPWKPCDLSDQFIVFRRRLGRGEEYVEDLRVRRNVVKRILKLLTAKGFHRPDRGEECRHFYYSACDIMSDNEIDELLPEDGLPEDMHFEDYDDAAPQASIDQQLFVEWLHEGQY